MNVIQKSEAIKTGLRKGFQDGSSKMARRKCYGYTINSDGELEINPDEAHVVCWIFGQYLAGNSLGKIAAGLERQGISSPTGRPKWNREANLLSCPFITYNGCPCQFWTHPKTKNRRGQQSIQDCCPLKATTLCVQKKLWKGGYSSSVPTLCLNVFQIPS